jgi:hypothetical protein
VLCWFVFIIIVVAAVLLALVKLHPDVFARLAMSVEMGPASGEAAEPNLLDTVALGSPVTSIRLKP